MFAVTPSSSDAGDGKVTQSVNLVGSRETGKVLSLSAWRLTAVLPLYHYGGPSESWVGPLGTAVTLSSCGGGLAGIP